LGFAVYLRKAVENGKVIFPGSPSVYGFVQTCAEHTFGQKLKCLECLRKSKSAHSFSAQYFNDPVDSESVEFKTEWVRRYEFSGELNEKLSRLRGLLSIDPAVRLKETNDYTGMVVTKVTPERTVYVVEAIQKRMSPQDLVNETFRLVDLYSVGKVLLETTSAQILFLDLFKNEMSKRGRYFQIQEVKSTTTETKAARIRGLIPYYTNGMILHKPGLTALEDQLLQFPRNTHDDILDALSHQVPYWKGHKVAAPVEDAAPHGSLNWWKKQARANTEDKFNSLFSDFIKKG
jgi:predicted phage terminase large subunit-like protein